MGYDGQNITRILHWSYELIDYFLNTIQLNCTFVVNIFTELFGLVDLYVKLANGDESVSN